MIEEDTLQENKSKLNSIEKQYKQAMDILKKTPEYKITQDLRYQMRIITVEVSNRNSEISMASGKHLKVQS